MIVIMKFVRTALRTKVKVEKLQWIEDPKQIWKPQWQVTITVPSACRGQLADTQISDPS
jgi:hypothetical protein